MVDDERDLVRIIDDRLKARGHEVLRAYTGEQGIRLATKDPDLIILDIMMPGYDGFEVCEMLRSEVDVPILFLSARSSDVDKVRALGIGGDDYLSKPFSMDELVARVEAHLRREGRAYSTTRRERKLFFGPLVLDLAAKHIRCAGEEISLSRREWEIVELLAMHPNQTLSREQILADVWGYGATSQPGAVAEHIKNIRAKLAAVDPSRDYIDTVWGIGYRWLP